MNLMKIFPCYKEKGHLIALCYLALCLLLAPGALGAKKISDTALTSRVMPFKPGETLTYEVSWSNIVTAGTAIMEVKEERLPNGRKVLRFIATSRSVGVVDKFYPVNDTIQSVFDPRIMQSLSFSLNENHGKRKRNRGLVFDHAGRTVVRTLNNDPPQTFTIPDPVQDALSSLFYLRTMEDFTIGKIHVIPVHDSDKNWSVEVQTLGREKVKTPAGKFNAIKVKTFPKYEGVFMNKGEIFIWLTDDSRKIPVLMKSTLSIGSIMTTLTDMKLGDEGPLAEKPMPPAEKAELSPQ
jgi:hypothetical protein